MLNIFLCVSLCLFFKCFCSPSMSSPSHSHPCFFSSLHVSVSHAHFSIGVHTTTLKKTRLFSVFIEATPRWGLRTLLGYKCRSLSLCPSLLFSDSARRCIGLQQFCNVLLLFLGGLLTLRSLRMWSLFKDRSQWPYFSLFDVVIFTNCPLFFFTLSPLLCISDFPALCPSPLFVFFQNAQ